MWTTEILFLNGYNMYRSFYNGQLMSELIEKNGNRHSISGICGDIRRAIDLGYGDGEIPKAGNGENMYDREEK